jgi:hypothetical protein
MSDNGNVHGRPMTRREIREREQAAAAAAAGQQGSAPPYGGGPTAGGVPPVPAAPSRRSYGDSSSDTYPGRPPVVRPPAATGGVRGLDETGRLTPVQRAGDAGVRPAAPPGPPAVPPRTSSRPPFGGSAPSAPAAPAPTPGGYGPSPVPPLPGGGSSGRFGTGGGGASSPFGSSPSGSGAVPGRPVSIPRTPPPGFPAPAGEDRGSAPSTQWSVAAPASVAPLSRPEASRPAAPASPFGSSSPADAGATAALPWETTPSAPTPARPAGSPFDALVGAGADQPVRARSSAAALPVDNDEDDWEEPSSSYTWLHYIILIVVAFVLGLLMWKLLLEGDDSSYGTDQASALVSTLLPPLRGAS